MWLRDPLVIEVVDNTVTALGFQFWDEVANGPLDVSGYSFACNIATADGQSRLVTISCPVTDAAAGEVDLAIDGEVFGEGRGERVFAGQIIATDEAGENVTAARIVLFVNEGIE